MLEREAAAIRNAGGKATVETLDVSDAAAVQRVTQSILARHGKVDILVNSAGLNNPQRFWRDQTVESWDQVIRINLDGTFYCTKAVIPSMRTQKDGVVINISSWAGKYTSAMVGAAYNGSKAAVVSLTETINMEECIERHSRLRHLPRGSRHPDSGSAPGAALRGRARQDVAGRGPGRGHTLGRRAAAARMRQRAHHQPNLEPTLRRDMAVRIVTDRNRRIT